MAQTDFLIIGAGVAGLRAALELAGYGSVLVVTKEAVRESNTHYAQGGIAVAMDGPDDVVLHLEDTIVAGDGLVNESAAETLVREGPLRVAELIEWGAQFDRDGGTLLRTREAAHSRPRILHANGDATGAEIGRALASLARNHTKIQFSEWTTVTNLAVADGRVAAADLVDQRGAVSRVAARAVLVAAGGAGQVYEHTTNPAVATGDGIALASRAGTELEDMEFYQFHPTALSLPGVPAFLLSEALRGEGAWLRNDKGERFMERYDARLELAPRDVVARAVWREGIGGKPVYLDMRHVTEIDLHRRFPGISAFLARHGLELRRDLVPVRPAAHYLMGGVRTDLDGRTSVRGLYAAGEAACTGLHGANRLASNSLLEGLVFGTRAGRAMLAEAPQPPALPEVEPARAAEAQMERIGLLVRELRQMMDRCAGLIRDEASLREGLTVQQRIAEELDDIALNGALSRQLVEAQSLCTVAEGILRSAEARTESRGAHFRADFPERDNVRFRTHSIYKRGKTVDFMVA